MECQLENIVIHYEMFGAGRPLLFLHGSAGDHQAWSTLIEPLFTQRTGWRRIYPDLPGHGATPAPEWLTTEDQLVQVLLAFIDHVIPNERFTLGGFSWGGHLARGILYHRLADLDGLLFIALSIKTAERALPERRVLIKDTAALGDLDEGLRGLVEGVVVVQSSDTIARLQAMQAEFQTVAQDDMAFAKRLRTGFSFELDRLSEPFAKPTLFLLGRQDHFVGYRDAWRLIEHFPRATFTVLDRAGHLLMIEQATLSYALVNDWLDRVEEGERG
jgi:pimeloyl-ACP methyl ester carboxylesterase